MEVSTTAPGSSRRVQVIRQTLESGSKVGYNAEAEVSRSTPLTHRSMHRSSTGVCRSGHVDGIESIDQSLSRPYRMQEEQVRQTTERSEVRHPLACRQLTRHPISLQKHRCHRRWSDGRWHCARVHRQGLQRDPARHHLQGALTRLLTSRQGLRRIHQTKENHRVSRHCRCIRSPRLGFLLVQRGIRSHHGQSRLSNVDG